MSNIKFTGNMIAERNVRVILGFTIKVVKIFGRECVNKKLVPSFQLRGSGFQYRITHIVKCMCSWYKHISRQNCFSFAPLYEV